MNANDTEARLSTHVLRTETQRLKLGASSSSNEGPLGEAKVLLGSIRTRPAWYGCWVHGNHDSGTRSALMGAVVNMVNRTYGHGPVTAFHLGELL